MSVSRETGGFPADSVWEREYQSRAESGRNPKKTENSIPVSRMALLSILHLPEFLRSKMRWLKHDTGARNDVRLRLVRKKFGMEGYGIYFAILELIGEQIEKDNIENWGYVHSLYNVGTLSDELSVNVEHLENIINYFIEVGLFEQKDGRIYCAKIHKRLDDYAERIRRESSKKKGRDKVRTKSRQGSESVRIKSDIEQNRIEQNRTEENIVTKETKVSLVTRPNGLAKKNPDIDLILHTLRQKLKLPKLDLTEKTNRQYVWSLLRKSKSGADGVLWLISVASADPWFKNHITSARDLWSNQVKIVASARKEAEDHARKSGIDARGI